MERIHQELATPPNREEEKKKAAAEEQKKKKAAEDYRTAVKAARQKFWIYAVHASWTVSLSVLKIRASTTLRPSVIKML